ncbi:hypothetical protein AYI68_g3665 [Smittium mucronatum]|uniref:Uncharacterized protein n=1 Tax=Smittium mucronatum TaxID=133383 RepID=A0A1R0GZD9_9FUNG|nr:hypothetical protein AYI68_g3665 [Smittium mucronatum]
MRFRAMNYGSQIDIDTLPIYFMGKKVFSNLESENSPITKNKNRKLWYGDSVAPPLDKVIQYLELDFIFLQRSRKGKKRVLTVLTGI